MSRLRKHHKNLSEIVLVNFFATLAKAFLAILIIYTLMPHNKKDIVEEGIKPNALYTIEVMWPDDIDYDIDTFVRLPDGIVVYYNAQQSGLLNLERDDTGIINDRIVVNGRMIVNPLNQEIVMVRGVVPGDYALTVMTYRFSSVMGEERSDTRLVQSQFPEPIKVKVVVKKLNPKVTILYTKTVTLTHNAQESFITRFTMDELGNITFDESLPTSIVRKVYENTNIILPEGAVD